MAYLLFMCPECSASLVDYELASGKNRICEQCGHEFRIPAAAIGFSCPFCTLELTAPAELAGSSFACPTCKKELEIPQAPRLRQVGEPPPDAERAGSVAFNSYACPWCGHMGKAIARIGSHFSCEKCKKTVVMTPPGQPESTASQHASFPTEDDKSQPCPACGKALAKHAVRCIWCGRDLPVKHG